MTAWVSPRSEAQHEVRVKVNLAHGRRMTIHDRAMLRAFGRRLDNPGHADPFIALLRLRPWVETGNVSSGRPFADRAAVS